MLQHTLTSSEASAWAQDHRLALSRPFSENDVAALQAWTDEIAEWPETPGQWMKYFETTGDSPRILCRVENFTQHHPGLDALIRGAGTLDIVRQLMGEEAILFKEKINFKKAGGAGFAAHQDAPAFATFGHRYHITMMVAIDDATVDNGCLEFAPPVPVHTEIPMAPDGTIAPDVEAEMTWTPLEAKAGDIVFFDSYIPHRSPRNASDRSRRALYITYNRLSEGDVRERYYADKRLHFPPECERVAGVDYTSSPSPYNLGNPIR